MLNNTVRNSQSGETVETTARRVVSRLTTAEIAAANASRFDQVERTSRLLRRVRRRNRLAGSATRGWRVALW